MDNSDNCYVRVAISQKAISQMEKGMGQHGTMGNVTQTLANVSHSNNDMDTTCEISITVKRHFNSFGKTGMDGWMSFVIL